MDEVGADGASKDSGGSHGEDDPKGINGSKAVLIERGDFDRCADGRSQAHDSGTGCYSSFKAYATKNLKHGNHEDAASDAKEASDKACDAAHSRQPVNFVEFLCIIASLERSCGAEDVHDAVGSNEECQYLPEVCAIDPVGKQHAQDDGESHDGQEYADEIGSESIGFFVSPGCWG